jgi:hypothetical protein
VGEARELPEPSLGYRWVKAHVYGALVNTIASFASFTLGKWLAVSDPGTGAVTTTLFIIVGGMIAAFSLAVLARLTGAVLARKLPLFPLRRWIELHVYLGFVLGLAVSFSATIPEEADPEPLTLDVAVVAAVAAAVIGVILGTLVGSLQALVLRKGAHGVKTWIKYSALGGTMLGPAILAVGLGPQTSFASEVAAETAGFIMSVAIGVILLPAVRRLQPREAASPAPDTSP